MEQLLFIGNGNMAKSIISGVVGNFEIEVAGRNSQKLEALTSSYTQPIKSCTIEGCDIEGKIVILCVKPANLAEVASKLKGQAKALISVLAGSTLQSLKEAIDAKSYLRAMPNIAAAHKASFTTLTGDIELKEKGEMIFDCIGKTLWLQSEKSLDIATALAGSGPAYLALIAEALTDGAVNQGLTRAEAAQATQGLFEGFSALLEHQHPALIKDSVMSPGGTTAAGYKALEKNGVRVGCMEAIEAAYAKAKALGKN